MFWQSGHKVNIDHSNIIKERAVICICWKWEGEKQIHSVTWDKNQNDKAALKEFVKILDEADEIVGHNMDRFDMAWVRTRCLYHGFEMIPKYLTVDTLKIARSKFRFNSNRLDYIAGFLQIGHKMKTDFSLWKEVLLNNDEKALAYMVKYCKGDVKLLEQVYEKLKNHIEPKQNYAVLYGDDRGNCPECGSDRLQAQRTKTTPIGTIKRVYRCGSCKKYHTKTPKVI